MLENAQTETFPVAAVPLTPAADEPREVTAQEPVADSATTPPPAAAAAAGQEKPTFPAPSAKPNIEGPRGIRYDFNLGARVLLP